MATPSATLLTAGAAAPSHGATKAVFPPFDSQHFFSQVFWLAICFGLIYYVMAKVALPRIQAILENRANSIAADLAEAERAQRIAADAAKAHDKLVADAKANAQSLAQAAQADQAALSEAGRKRLNEELDAKLDAAEAQIARKRSEAMSSVQSIAGEAAAAIVERLTGIAATPERVEAALSSNKA